MVPGIVPSPRVDLWFSNENGGCVGELKLARRRYDFLQLADYLVASNNPVGYLIVFLKNKVNLYTLLQIDTRLYCYHNHLLFLLPIAPNPTNHTS